MAKSIVVKDFTKCLFCGRPMEAKHHVFGGSNRRNSERFGLTVPLCNEHHNMSNHSVHMDRDMDIKVKAMAQIAFENKYGHEKFMQVFGKNFKGEEK